LQRLKLLSNFKRFKLNYNYKKYFYASKSIILNANSQIQYMVNIPK